MKTATLAIILSLLCNNLPAAIAPDGFQWTDQTINGNSYLPMEDVRKFYQFEKITKSANSIILENARIKAEFRIDDQKARLNGILYHLSEPIRIKDDNAHLSRLDLVTLIDPALRPHHHIPSKPLQTIILDPGHGGKDKGSAGLEAKLTLGVARQTRDLLQKNGYNVIMTRDDDLFIPLEERLKIINSTANAVVISLHFNSGKKEAEGIETYVMSARTPHPTVKSSTALATAIHSRCLMHLNRQKLAGHYKLEDRGIQHAAFPILKDSQHPTILIEAGFLTNETEAAVINTPAYQKNLALSITRGIETYQASIKK